ncbi:hypothetical protein KPL78_07190 [Roseomonas sp. HJA6]|uniref:Uncharacterized protein n=1 Tax=Roseomonas alba TaxID=2846776 RepID=A0ABS7A774_9PROT|nr:hypothetical protein [Neoroseomonas alba]MBW6397622.1 hypothetical protein [Neoroseomonas alba]
MSAELSIPHDTAVRVLVPNENMDLKMSFLVLLAVPPRPASLETMVAPDVMKAIVTHDAGDAWPDAWGCALTTEVLRRGGAAALGFATLADALACRRRLEAVREP